MMCGPVGQPVQESRSEIVAGKRSITPDTGLRLLRYLGMDDGFWIGLQADHDMALTRESL
jgi:addiction module HigA family antidote